MTGLQRFWVSALIIGLSLAMLITGCARRPRGAAGGTVQIRGSDTMVNLGEAWAEQFMKTHRNAQIAVTGGGSGTGIAQMINGTIDIAMASRAMSPKEIADAKKNGVSPKEIEVAYDAIVVVVNPANPVRKLTIGQLADIYTGRVKNWKQVGGPDLDISILSRDKNSGTHVYFLEHILRKGNARGPEEFGPSVLMLPSSQAIADEVATNRAAIGYFGLGYLNPKRHRAVAVAKSPAAPYVEPTPETALSGKYPISRPLYLYTNGTPTGAIKEFVDFTLSPEGQRLADKEGFVSLRGAR